ncbi:MAG: hypothetical protein K8S87_08680 [Planctomycetes bacterium]|nr:hypothetical protein [Planctomycetota bacterium]
MSLTEHELENSYAPSTLLNIFPQLLGKMISVRGKYEKNAEVDDAEDAEQDAKDSADKYIDFLRDETTHDLLKLEVGEGIRDKITDGITYIFKGVLEHKTTEQSKFELMLLIDDFHEGKVTKLFSIFNLKHDQGYKQPDVLLKNMLKDKQVPEIAFILSNSKIIETEIKENLHDYDENFNFTAFTADLSSKDALINVIDEISNHQSEFDAVVLMDNPKKNGFGLFDDDYIAQKLILSKSMLNTSTENDSSLLQKISDKSFKAADEFGKFLYDIAYQSDEENNRQKLMEIAEAQLEDKIQEIKSARNMIEDLEEVIEKLNSRNEESEDKLAELEQSTTSFESRIQEALSTIDEYETKNMELEDEIDKLSKDLRHASMEQNAVDGINQEVLEKNMKLVQNLNSVQNEIDQMSQELSHQIQKRMDVEDNFSSITQQLSRVETDKKMIEENKNQLASALEGLSQQLEMLDAEANTLKKNLNTRELKIIELNGIVDESLELSKNTLAESDYEILELKKKYFKQIMIFCIISLLIGIAASSILL